MDGVLANVNISFIDFGGATAFAVSTEGKLYGWGYNQNYAIGDRTTTDRVEPVEVFMEEGLYNKKIKQIANPTHSEGYTVVLTTDYQVYAWGNNGNGQLGDGTKLTRDSPVRVKGFENKKVIHVARGKFVSFAITDDGKVYSWGRGSSLLGIGSTTDQVLPVEVTSNLWKTKTMAKISAGNGAAIVLSTDHKMYTWGVNNYGQLGDGTTTERFTPVAVIMDGELSGHTVVDVSAGSDLMACLTNEGRVFSWGSNQYGSLGDWGLIPSNSYRTAPYPIYIDGFPLDKRVVQFGTQAYNVVVLTEDGKIFSWGRNNVGQLGIGSTTDQNRAKHVSLPAEVTSVKQLSVGVWNFMILPGEMPKCYGKAYSLACNYPIGICTEDGTCECLLKNYTGPNCDIPTFTCYGKNVSEGGCGPHGKCIGQDKCDCDDGWTGDRCDQMLCHGKLPSVACSYPNGTCADANKCSCKKGYSGVECENIICFGKIGTDACNHPNGVCVAPDLCRCNGFLGEECDIRNTIYTFGRNTNDGTLGFGASNTNSYSTPRQVDMFGYLSGVNVSKVFAQAYTGYALSTDNQLYAWGYGTTYELCDMTRTSKNRPVESTCQQYNPIKGKVIRTMVSSSASPHSVAVLTSEGKMYTWGPNTYGEIGDRTVNVPKDHPVEVKGLLEGKRIVSIAAGDSSMFAVTDEGKVYAWGKNAQGQLGMGDTTNRYEPTPVDTGPESVLRYKFVLKVASKYRHTLALATDNQIVAWGENSYGRLGDGTTSNKLRPVNVIMDLFEGAKVVDVEAGTNFSLALTSEGRVFAWGRSDIGALGDLYGTNWQYPHPVYSEGELYNKLVIKMVTGSGHTLALTSEGRVYVWGYNEYGQLGLGHRSNIYAPTELTLPGKVGDVAASNTFSIVVIGNLTGCYGKYGSLACNYPRGVCVAPNVCECAAEFFGDECESHRYTCYGKNLTEACNYPYGKCNGPDLCECTLGYGGKECTEYNCFGKIGKESCSYPNGTCEGTNKCVCEEGYTGPECQHIICFGKIGTDACNYPNGDCVAPDQCYCYGYNGNECQYLNTIFATGRNYNGQLGRGGNSDSSTFVSVRMNEALSGSDNVDIYAQYVTTYVIGATGKIFGWGRNQDYQLADYTTSDRQTPILMFTSGTTLQEKKIKMIASPIYIAHNLVLTTDGLVFAWGSNNFGQLGDGTTTTRTIPISVKALESESILMIAAGNGTSFALTTDGKIFGWGYGGNGTLGTGEAVNHYTPVQVKSDGALKHKTILKISIKKNHILALSSDGVIFAWGDNQWGKLGDGTAITRFVPIEVNMKPFLGKRVVDIDTGSDFSLALTEEGRVYAWGFNKYGSIGIGSEEHVYIPTPVYHESNLYTTITQISAGYWHAIVLSAEGRVYTWGHNNYGDLGLGHKSHTYIPQEVNLEAAGIYNVSKVAAGGFHSVILTGNRFGCYGKYGALACSHPRGVCVEPDTCECRPGYSGPECNILSCNSPTKNVSECDTITCFGKSPEVGCNYPRGACVANDLCYCFGYIGEECQYQNSLFAAGINTNGEQGNGNNMAQNVFGKVDMTAVLQGLNFTKVIAHLRSSFVITNEGKMYGWGGNDKYQLDDMTNINRFSPIAMRMDGLLGKKKVRTIASSTLATHVLALTTDGQVWAWGSNSRGQLGDGSTTDKSVPLIPNDLDGKFITHIATGEDTSFALSDDGIIYSWGQGKFLGHGGTTNRNKPIPIESNVLKSKYIVRISSKAQHTLALSSDGLVFAWGENSNGRLGIGNTAFQETPAEIRNDAFGGLKVVEIEAGTEHSLAITENGMVFSWGYNGRYNLGDFTNVNYRAIPARVFHDETLFNFKVVQIAAGYAHSLALTEEGRVFSWGYNANGQLGIGSFTNKNKPVEVDLDAIEATEVISISAGQHHSLILTGNRFSCYGKYGALACSYPRGECVAPDTCQCISTFTGKECEIPTYTCYGKNVTVACNALLGGGICNGPDICECFDGWRGPECTEYVCFGKIENDACSYPNGTCTYANTCTCKPGYNGTECENTLCFGKTGTDACNHPQGSCVAPDQCYCFGHGGRECEHKMRIYAFGYNNYYSLGIGNNNDQSVPTLVNTGTHSIKKIFMNRYTGYAITDVNTLLVWGYNTHHELCNSGTAHGTTPVVASCASSSPLVGKRFKSLASASDINSPCLLSEDGKIFCWGYNYYGDVGDGNTGSSAKRYTPYQVLGPFLYKTIYQIAKARYATLALTTDGTVYSWGYNNYDQLGHPSLGTDGRTSPGEVYSGGILKNRVVLKVSAANVHVLVLTSDRIIIAWGYNANGRLGDGTTTNSAEPVSVRMEAFGGKKVVDIEAGSMSSYAITEDGKVWSWGSNDYGQLGDLGEDDRYIPGPVYDGDVLKGKKIVKLAAGLLVLAISSDGKVFSWGHNSYGSLGIGHTSLHLRRPIEIDLTSIGVRNISDVAVGAYVSLMLTGEMYECYGKYGALACNHPQGHCVDYNVCECFDGYAGSECQFPTFTCYGKSQSEACNYPHGFCAGQDSCACNDGWTGPQCTVILCYGELPSTACSSPNGTCEGANHCVCKPGYTGDQCEHTVCFGKIGTDACNYPHGSCVAPDTCLCYGRLGKECDIQNEVFAAGMNTYGQLGIGSTEKQNTFVRLDMTKVLAAKNITSVIGLRYTSFLIANDGSLYGFGRNDYYQLYDGTKENRITPIACSMQTSFFGRKIKTIASSVVNNHVLALTTDGLVYAWGENTNGQIGDDTTITKEVPRLVEALMAKNVIDIAVGDGVSLALTDEGKVYTWGKGDKGVLGYGETYDRLVPGEIIADGALGKRFVTKISCTYNHVLVITSDRKIFAWGDNTKGKLGDGSVVQQNEPVAVYMSPELRGKKVVDVAAGGEFSLALTADSVVFAWGSNEYYSLGDYTDVDRLVPHRVYADEILQFKQIVSIAAGLRHAVVLASDGNVYTWGYGYYGQLGLGNTENYYKPMAIDQSSIGKVTGIAAGSYHTLLLTGSVTKCYNKTGAAACSYPNGRCVAEDTCVCVSYYSGKECEQPTYNCFGKPIETACNAPVGGQCISKDLCECKNGFFGLECKEYTCFGKHGNESCSGHGTCVGVDTCICDDGYTGDECEIPICFGKTRFTACSYPKGECIDKDTCKCFGYSGDECNIPVCYGKVATQACNYPHGHCVDVNKCECEVGYAGEQCDKIGCFGKPPDIACNYPFGVCIGRDNCNCTEGYGGAECLPKCFDKIGEDACNKKGTCILPDVCDCQLGWWGFQCEAPVCYGKYGDAACSKNGKCVDADTCICYTNFFGADCSKLIIPSTTEIPLSTKNLDIHGKGFSTFLGENVVSLKVGSVTPKCTVIYASPTRITCSLTGLSLGTLYATVTVQGHASPEFQIATVIGTVSITPSNKFIAGYETTLTINGDGFSNNMAEMKVELYQSFNKPTCVITSTSTTEITCALSGLANGVLFATVIRNGISSELEMVAIVDALPPVAGVARIIADYSTDYGFVAQEATNYLRASWDEFYDEGTYIDHYEVAVYSGDEVVKPFYDVGPQKSVTIAGLSLSLNQNYSVHVRAVDGFGYASEEVATSPVSIILEPIIPIPLSMTEDRLITATIRTFSIIFDIPKALYEDATIDLLELHPIRRFDDEVVDPIETVPRMIGFIVKNPKSDSKFSKPLRLTIPYSIVSHIVKPTDTLRLRIYDKNSEQWLRAIDTCSGYTGDVYEYSLSNNHHVSICQLGQFALFVN